MKKILIVSTLQSNIAEFHKSFIKLLQTQGYVVHVAAKNNLSDKKGLTLDEPDKIFNLNLSRSPFKLNNIKKIKELRAIINQNNYDIIHCHTPVGSVVTRLANKNKKIKVVYTAHGFHFYKGAPLINWLLYYPVEKYLSKKTDLLLTINKEDYDRANKKFKKTKVELINGVGINELKFKNPKNINLKESFPNIDNPFIITIIGELNNNKNQKFIINEMRKITKINSDIVVAFIGNGPNYKKYQNLIDKYELTNNIKLLGYRTDVPSIINESKLVVSASIREGQGLNIIEAMVLSKITLASKNRGHNDIIEHGVNGYIFDLKKKDDFLNKLKYIYINYDVLQLIKNNALNSSKKYLTDNINESLIGFYKELA